jgi:hypothetical protein
MTAREGIVRLMVRGAAAAMLAVPGLPLAPRVGAAGLQAPPPEHWAAWPPGAATDTCASMVQFSRPRSDRAGTVTLPVRLYLDCEEPLADIRLTLDGNPTAADIGVRGGQAQVIAEIVRPAGSPSAVLCLSTLLLTSPPESVSRCATLPETPPARQSGPAFEREAPAAPPAPGTAAPSARQRLPEARGSVEVVEAGGGPVEPKPSDDRRASGPQRSGPDTSMKLPEGYVWALEESREAAPPQRPAAESGPLERRPARSPIDVLEMTGGPASSREAPREPDAALQRAVRPPAPPARPQVLVKAGDHHTADLTDRAGLAGLLLALAGAALHITARRSAQP